MCPIKSNLKIKKINPASFAQALGKLKKESYQTIHVFHSKFQSTQINLFVFNSTAVEKIWSPFDESKITTFPWDVLLSYTNISCCTCSPSSIS